MHRLINAAVIAMVVLCSASAVSQQTTGGGGASGGGTGGVTAVSGTLNQIDSTGGATPVLSIDSLFTFPGTVTNNLSVFGATTSAQLAAVISDETGSGLLVFGTSPTLVTPALGTPSAVVLTNATGLPVASGISGLGTGVATFLTTPSSANLAAAVTDETGSGLLVFGTSPTLVTPALGTPASGVATNLTGLPLASGVTGTLPTANGGSWVYYGTDSGAVNAYVVTTTPALTAYTAGEIVCFIPANAPTGASTVNVSGLGTKNWMKATTAGVAALGATGDMNTTTSFCARYDGTQFVLLSPSSTPYISGANSAGQVMLGNSNNQMTSSNKVIISNATGAFTTYNGVATTGVGASAVYASPAVIVIGSGASIGNTSLCSTTLCPAGTYTIHAYLDITTACGTTGTYSVNLLYTDDQGAKSTVINFNGAGAVPATGLVTTTSTANFGQESQTVRTTGAANNALGSINYSTAAVACGTAGPMVGNLYLSVTREQ